MGLEMSIAASPGPLLGRAAEVGLLVSLLDGTGTGGGALVLQGEPGIGKSRLLSVAAGLARERGFTVLHTTGVQSEARLAFADVTTMTSTRPRGRAQAFLNGVMGAVLATPFRPARAGTARSWPATPYTESTLASATTSTAPRTWPTCAPRSPAA
jgi:AAA ATPase domain